MIPVVEKVLFLQNVEVFAAVSTEHLSHVAAVAEAVEYVSGDVVYEAGEAADAMYVVVDGAVTMQSGEGEVARAAVGEAFGVWSLFDDVPRVVTALADGNCRLLRVDRDDFGDLLADNAEITRAIFKTLVERIRGLADRFGISPAPAPARQTDGHKE